MSTVDIKYIASSGNVYDLKSDRFRLREANFHKWAWIPIEITNLKGSRVTGWRKEPALYETSLFIKGTKEERARQVDKLHGEFETDIAKNKAGKIVWGGWSIDCFITSSSTYPDEYNNTVNEIAIYCPSSFWNYEKTRSFFAHEQGEVLTGLDYPYDYPYDFAKSKVGVETWQIDHNMPSQFKMRIYGACTNPRITINNHVYQMFISLADGEYIEIDSRNATIYKYSNNQRVNVFDLRYKEEDIFEDIPSGQVQIVWNGSFGFDITLYLSSSEPRWTTS